MGRGRPKAAPDFIYDGLRKMYPRLCHRQRLNQMYALEALNALRDLPCFGYFYDAKRDRAKTSVLAELGRLRDVELIRRVGAEVAEVAERQKLTVKEVERLLRRYRLGLQKGS
ncbi:MAG: hypothetical protein AB1523_12345 [Bacillota bacterium]